MASLPPVLDQFRIVPAEGPLNCLGPQTAQSPAIQDLSDLPESLQFRGLATPPELQFGDLTDLSEPSEFGHH